MRFLRWVGGVVLACAVGAIPAATPEGLTQAEREQLDRDVKDLADRLGPAPAGKAADPWADAAVFRKGALWALRFEAKLAPADVELVKKAVRRGRERADALAAGKSPWADRKGKVVRAYVSAVDGSVQPYGLIVPAGYDPTKPARLDVVLHGSTRPVGLSELRFMARFDDGDAPATTAPDQNYLELHPLGRVENCYRWAGETDVFEAIEAVCRNYAVDRDRIVLRGMSMGASGTWHLGLKHPGRFAALGPYCGYVDTHEFSKTPLGNFVPVGELPPYQEATLHMLDSVDYAANAGVVPAVACMGEKDVFFQAHVIMGRAMEREGLTMVNLISPGTGHVVDPVTHKEQMRRIAGFADKGLDHAPKHLRFVTWTLKYGECHWLRVLGLGEHYRRAEIDATIAADGTLEVKEPVNVTRFAVLPPALGAKPRLRVGGTEVALPAGAKGAVVGRRGGAWAYLGEPGAVELPGKRPGLQGPIDDAFTGPFLCVRGTGKAWNPAVGAWADASLKQFAEEWAKYFRGDLPVKDDTAATADDIRSKHLILFGDPGSNSLVARVLPKLPVGWTKDEVRVGKETFPAASHAPVLIQPNRLNPDRYVVLNSGHTFGEKALAAVNYLLFPRLGDWAVLDVGAKGDGWQVGPGGEAVARAGFFDEAWHLPEPAPGRDPFTLRGHTGWVGGVAFAPDGRTLATASGDGTARLWDAASGREVGVLKGHADAVASVAFAPDGKTLATASYDGTAKVWDAATRRELHTLRGHRGIVMSVAFAPDGNTLATAGVDATVRLWDPATGREVAALTGHKSWVNALAFTPDGATLVTASSDTTVRLWDVAGRKERTVLRPKAAEVRSVAVSPDGKWLAAGTRYGVVKVWDAATGAEVASLKGHAGDVWAVAFAPDGRTLASGDGDWNRPGDVRLWAAPGWAERGRLRSTGEVLSLAFAPKGARLAAGGWDRTATVWDLADLPAKADR